MGKIMDKEEFLRRVEEHAASGKKRRAEMTVIPVGSQVLIDAYALTAMVTQIFSKDLYQVRTPKNEEFLVDRLALTYPVPDNVVPIFDVSIQKARQIEAGQEAERERITEAIQELRERHRELSPNPGQGDPDYDPSA